MIAVMREVVPGTISTELIWMLSPVGADPGVYEKSTSTANTVPGLVGKGTYAWNPFSQPVMTSELAPAGEPTGRKTALPLGGVQPGPVLMIGAEVPVLGSELVAKLI